MLAYLCRDCTWYATQPRPPIKGVMATWLDVIRASRRRLQIGGHQHAFISPIMYFNFHWKVQEGVYCFNLLRTCSQPHPSVCVSVCVSLCLQWSKNKVNGPEGAKYFCIIVLFLDHCIMVQYQYSIGKKNCLTIIGKNLFAPSVC